MNDAMIRTLYRRARRLLSAPARPDPGQQVTYASSEAYWDHHNVAQHRRFDSARESLDYFHWRNDQYPGYIDLMPVSGHDGEAVLDFGCGPGNDLVGFACYSRPRRLIAMDVAQKALDEARARMALHGAGAEYIKIREDDARLPLDDGGIDYVHCSGVLMCVRDPLATLREFHRVLRPGGRARLMVYNHDSLWMHLYVGHVLRRRRPEWRQLTNAEIFLRSTDGEACPVNRCWRVDEFLELGTRAGFRCRHLGNAVSLTELDLLPQRFQAAMYADLPEESRRFLLSLRVDERGLPHHDAVAAGIDACFEFAQ
jgi:ubiquinone/menaquinone biosynthesis C-methylase UbiE